jgi:hypothetical protein
LICRPQQRRSGILVGGNLIVRLRAFDDQRATISEGASTPHGVPALTLQNGTYDEVKHG